MGFSRSAAALLAVLASLVWTGSALPSSSGVVISQVYGGGGNSGATFKNDFIELYNAGPTTVSLSDWSVQYASSAGSSWQKTGLSGSIAPGGYYLVQQAAGSGGTVDLPTPDAIGGIFMSASSGKVALVASATTLTGSCPATEDFVGYGTANCFEGSGAAPGLTNTTAALRGGSGAIDTGDNAADFAAGAPSPRNSSFGTETGPSVASVSPANGAIGVAVGTSIELVFSEPVAVAGDWFSIDCTRSGAHAATVSGGPQTWMLDPAADFVEDEACDVTIRAANVTDLDADDPPDAMAEDATISFRTFRVTKIHEVQGAGGASPLDGQRVTIEGIVIGVDDEVGSSVGDGNRLRRFAGDAGIYVQEEAADWDGDPATSEGIFVGFVDTRMSIPLGSIVRLEGRVDEQFGLTEIEEAFGTEPQIVGVTGLPAPITLDEAAGAAQDPVARPYYESLEGMRVRAGVAVASSGGRNKFGETFLTLGPEQDRLFRTETDATLFAADADAGAGNPFNPNIDTDSVTALQADLFDTVRDLVGPLGFSFGHYKLLPQIGAMPTIDETGVAYPYAGLDPAAALELRIASFNVENFFPVGGALDGGTITPAQYDEKKDRIVDAIGRLLRRPDVVAVQEVVDLAVLEDVAAQLGGYTAYLVEGNDSRGIDVGYLVKDTVKASNLRQLGKEATTELDDCADFETPGGEKLLFDRPPLALDVTAPGIGRITLVTNHWASKSHPDACREAQAAFVRDFVASVEAADGRAVVTGDLNAFEDERAVELLSEGTTLANLWSRAPEQERYSFAFQGKLQTLDHILVSSALERRVADFRYAHFDVDYFDRETTTDGHKVSDHDPPVLTLRPAGQP